MIAYRSLSKHASLLNFCLFKQKLQFLQQTYVMYKKYTTPLPYCWKWGSRKTYRDGPANKTHGKNVLPVYGAGLGTHDAVVH